MTHRLPAIGMLALLIGIGAQAGDAHWPRFRGPNGTGISEATTVPVKWTENDYNWTAALPGMGHSSPVVWGERIYVTCCDRKTATRTVVCLAAGSGRAVWRRDYPSKTFRQTRDNSYASATPATDAAGVVVTWSTPEEVVLLALDRDGRDVWKLGLGPYVGGHGTGASPIIVGDLVVLPNDQEDPKALPSMYGRNPKMATGKSFLVGVDRATGAIRWKTERRTRLSAYSTPCLAPSPDGRPELIFTSTAHGITAVDPATGTVNWEVGNVFRDRCVGSPVVADGLVVAGYGAGSRGARHVAVRPGSRAKGLKPEVVYDITKPVPLVPTAVARGGRLFLWGDDGRITCHEASSGKTIWQGRVPAAFYASPVCVGGRLYGISKKGEVFVVAASDKFELLGRVPLGEPCFASPAVAGGVMYLRTLSRLFSLGGR